MERRTEVSGVAPKSARLDVVVVALAPELSRVAATRLVREGHVQVDGVVITRASETVQAGTPVAIVLPPPVPTELVGEDLPLRIVHEDADIIVIDKDPGMVVHPGAGHTHGTLVNALLHHVDDLSGVGGEERPGIVHRLDRGTSGLIVVAKHDQAHRALAAQFADHSAYRTYLGITLGIPDRLTGTITSSLARDPKDRLRFASTDSSFGKEAITHWRQLASGRGLALVACRLETGRTHQIRVQLTEQGWPLVGDPLYRRRFAQPPPWLSALVPPDRPMLHAWRLAFDHPSSGERMVLEAPVPADILAVLAAASMGAPKKDPFDR